jgi:hypothetical protein
MLQHARNGSFRSMYLRITAVRDVCVQLSAALIVAIASTAPAVSAAQNDRIRAAETAALSWLAQIDVGAYDDGWEQATGLIHHRDKATWTGWMRERRGGLGDLLQRTTVYTGPIRFSRNEPDGKYLEIEYDTTFSGLSHLFEYVRMVRCEDGVWRVYWYFVRQRSPTELSQVDHK